MAQLSALCGMDIDEIARLEQADQQGRMKSASADSDDDEPAEHRAATERDEVEARVDTGIVLRRLERFFAALPERERQVIDAYLGVGLSPTQLAARLQVTPSRVSQIFGALVRRIALHFGQDPKRAMDRLPDRSAAAFEQHMAQREVELATRAGEGPWGRMVEEVLSRPRPPLRSRRRSACVSAATHAGSSPGAAWRREPAGATCRSTAARPRTAASRSAAPRRRHPARHRLSPAGRSAWPCHRPSFAEPLRSST
jgi:Sigma-70, region 4